MVALHGNLRQKHEWGVRYSDGEILIWSSEDEARELVDHTENEVVVNRTVTVIYGEWELG